ncbi:MAG: efflux RND transporter permease subunit [Proteobacteria bacterium]|nr:efflux RND transporter permease subunit [Pseudomonadota bacterium]
MNLPGFSVGRPIFTAMVTFIVLTLGAASLSRLRIDMLPEIEMPRLTVRTGYEGAAPEVMERLVTQPIEEIIATVPGVEEITSISSEGNSSVRVAFAWGIDIDVAAQDVRSRLEDELNELPEDVTRPQIRKFDIASFPVVLLGIASNLDPVELTELIEEHVRYRFARLPGVAQVDLWGGYHREIRVELDPERIRALELPLERVLRAIRDSNVDLPAGEIEDGRHEVRLRTPAEYRNLDEIRQTVVTVRQGAPVTVGQFATVIDGYEKLTRIVRVNGQLGLRVAIRKQADANTVQVSQRVLAEIERINQDFPQIEIIPVINQGNLIERSISNVANSVMYGGGLAVLVLLFFLRNVRSTLIISLAIPISVIATFALVYLGGFSLNLMTLGGLALGVGMMVDSSIVVLENIFRRRSEEREPSQAAAVAGAREVAGAIVASTITTLIIFLPLMFVRGVAGLLFRELAFVVGFSLICALLVALSLVPMLASRLLGDAEGRDGGGAGWTRRFVASAGKSMSRLGEAYRDLLQAALRRRLITLALASGATALSLWLWPLVGHEFMPPSDEGEVRLSGEMELGTRLDLVDRQTQLMERMIEPHVPEARATVVSVGSSGYRPDSGARGRIQLSLVPATARKRSNAEIAADLRRRLDNRIPGMIVRTRAPQGQFVLERVLGNAGEGLTVEVRGLELATIDALAARVVEALADVPGVTDVESTRKDGVPQAELRVETDKAAQLGLSARQVAEVIEIAVAGRQAGEYRPHGKQYRILVQFRDAERLSLEQILDLTLETPAGDTVALRNVVTVDRGRGPVLIDRKEQQRLVSVTANVAGRDLGSVGADVQAKLARIPRPLGYDLVLAGAFEEQQKAAQELVLSLLLALVLVYMVLACQYESLRDPFVVILSVPVAATGVLLALWLTGSTLNVQSYIGCIMLGGIAVNNAILLIDQAGQLRAQGMDTHAAVSEAGRRRLRPILMTTMTTILGLLPLAFGVGEGAEAQAPLARAVIGGLTASTAITLLLIPVVYSMLHPERLPPARSHGSARSEAVPLRGTQTACADPVVESMDSGVKRTTGSDPRDRLLP